MIVETDDSRSDIQPAPVEVDASSGGPPLIGVFKNRFGEWRAVWRMLLFGVTAVILVVPLGFLAGWVARLEPDAGFISWTRSLTWVAGDTALILAGVLVLRFFDRRPWTMLGLGFSRGWACELGIGLVAGIVVTGLVVGVLVATGTATLGLSDDPVAALAGLPLLLWLFTVAGALEELLFRGYLMQALAEGSRPWIAGLATSLLFTWAHGDNPDVTLAGVANIFFAGVVLAVLYFRTRRLWLPIGFHLSWNLAQGWLWGSDVSGIEISDQLFVMTPVGPDLVTGGEFGLEGSILSTVILVLLILWLASSKVLAPQPGVAESWDRYPSGFGLEPKVGRESVGGDSDSVDFDGEQALEEA